MRLGQGLLEAEVDSPESQVPEPRLLVELEPRHRVFLHNLKSLFWPEHLPPLRLVSWPAPPWPDVLVSRRLPWWGWAQSAVLHLAAIAAFVGAARIWPHRIQVAEPEAFRHEDVIYYEASEYLPPLDTGGSHVYLPKGDPAFAPQPIISVPPESDNRSQTIVTPPNVGLDHDVPLPNMVAWSQVQPSVPLAATTRSAADMRVPAMAMPAVAPPPDVQRHGANNTPSLQQAVVAPPPEMNSPASQRALQSPQAAVIAPPPQVENAASIRKLGDINIGHAEAVAPAPQLPVGEQRSAARAGSLRGGGPAAVPPPPSIQGAGTGTSSGGQIIALSVHPLAPNASAAIPAGNRRGTFAATPQGKPGAAGTPDSHSDQTDLNGASGTNAGKNGSGTGSSKAAAGVPPGLYVGAATKPGAGAISGGEGAGTGAGTGASHSQSPDDARLVAKANPPRVSTASRHPVQEVADLGKGEVERQVFGDRKYYSMMVSMPNLSSAGGSWIIRFAELKKADSDPPSSEKDDVSAPVATQQVDPRYPLELMRRNVQGTVTLYAVIHADGTVSDVKVLRGVDDRIDEYAREALAGWQFRPGTKNGSPVDIEAVVVVPFKPMRMKPAF